MGYHISIGELEYDAKEAAEGATGWFVETIKNHAAPQVLGVPFLDKSNDRSPSYTAWRLFSMEADVSDFFYDSTGRLKCESPGFFEISSETVEYFQAAYERYKKTGTGEGYDQNVNRLEWLAFWTDYALKNCTRPAMIFL